MIVIWRNMKRKLQTTGVPINFLAGQGSGGMAVCQGSFLEQVASELSFDKKRRKKEMNQVKKCAG